MPLTRVQWCLNCTNDTWHRRTVRLGWRCLSCGGAC